MRYVEQGGGGGGGSAVRRRHQALISSLFLVYPVDMPAPSIIYIVIPVLGPDFCQRGEGGGVQEVQRWKGQIKVGWKPVTVIYF